MADNINFSTIPVDWNVPGANIEIDPSRAVRGLPQFERNMLVIGQRLDTGTIAAGEVVTVTRETDGVDFFGRGSMLSQQISAIRKVNPYTNLYAIALDDDAAGNAAAGTITVAGSATQSGTLYLMIGGRQLNTGVVASASAAQVASAIADRINGDADGAVTATAADAVVTVTARHKGEEGNHIDIRLNYYQNQNTPAGLNVAIADMAGGTGNPDINIAIAAMSNVSAYTILNAYTDPANVDAIEDELVQRWGGMQMRQGHSFGHINGTYAEIAAYGEARNSPHSTFTGLNDSPTLPWVISAQVGAAVEFSGANDPAVPFRSLAAPDVLAPSNSKQFIDTERNLLLGGGISTLVFDRAGSCYIEQMVTTYQENTYGMDDRSLRKLNTKWTVDYMAFVFKADVLNTFPRHKLAGDDVLDRIQPGQPIATPKLIDQCIIGSALKLEKVGLLEDVDQFIADLRTVRSLVNENRVNSILVPNTVNQFDHFAAAVQYIL